MSGSLPRMERGRSRFRPPSSFPRQERAPQYCIETTAYQAGAEINIVMVLRDDSDRDLCVERKFSPRSQQLVRSPAADHPPDRNFAERAIVDRAADAARGRTRRFARSARSLASRAEACIYQVRSRKAGSAPSPSFATRSGKIRPYSPCYSSLVQMNNVEHFVHPGLFHDLEKAKTTLELAKRSVQLDPVDSRAHLCCGWSYVMAQREAEAAPHMDLACELNDNDPWTLLSSAAYCALLRIDRAGRIARRAVAWHFRRRRQISDGATRASSLPVRRLCRRAWKPSIGRRASSRRCPPGGRRRCFILGQTEAAREEAQRFLNGIRSFWVGSSAPTDEAITRWASAGPSDQREFDDGKPCATACVAQGFLSKASLDVLIAVFRSRC